MKNHRSIVSIVAVSALMVAGAVPAFAEGQPMTGHASAHGGASHASVSHVGSSHIGASHRSAFHAGAAGASHASGMRVSSGQAGARDNNQAQANPGDDQGVQGRDGGPRGDHNFGQAAGLGAGFGFGGYDDAQQYGNAGYGGYDPYGGDQFYAPDSAQLDQEYDNAPVQYGRSVAIAGDSCVTPVKVCTLYHTSYTGLGCSCRVEGGRAQGVVAP